MNNSVVALTILHIPGLKYRERIKLLSVITEEKGFSQLSLVDLEYLVGRPLSIPQWNPQALLALGNKDLVACQRRGIAWVQYNDFLYPPLLRELSDPPLVLFYRGTLPDPEKPLVAIVGTRHPDGVGRSQAYQLGKEFGQAGYGVVSGLALGIDAMAHRGNVEGGGKTVAVLGSGLDGVYPVSNRPLAERILGVGGVLISEYPPGTPPYKWHFPARNRIIAGLARTVIIVEAPEHSGALITANFALEQGRDLYVGSCCTESPQGAGGRALIEEGARVVSHATTILNDWKYMYMPVIEHH